MPAAGSIVPCPKGFAPKDLTNRMQLVLLGGNCCVVGAEGLLGCSVTAPKLEMISVSNTVDAVSSAAFIPYTCQLARFKVNNKMLTD